MPTAAAPFGNVGRNSLRGPNFWQWDLGVDKNFRIPVREGMRLQFRSEYFNLFNRVNLATSNLDTQVPTTFGKILTANDPRILQFGLKLMF